MASAVWQEIVIDLSENRNQKEEETKEYFKSFRRIDDSAKDVVEEISLHNIRPNCNAKIYRTSTFNISAKFPNICKVTEETLVNEDDNTVIGIGNTNCI